MRQISKGARPRRRAQFCERRLTFLRGRSRDAVSRSAGSGKRPSDGRPKRRRRLPTPPSGNIEAHVRHHPRFDLPSKKWRVWACNNVRGKILSMEGRERRFLDATPAALAASREHFPESFLNKKCHLTR